MGAAFTRYATLSVRERVRTKGVLSIGPCPKCDGDMFLISITSKNTRFLGCTKRCGHTQSLPKNGRLTILKKVCEKCGWRMIRVKEQGKDAREFCANRVCAQSSKQGNKK
ncbi:MAG: hypothetical protein U9P81_01100 [Euryarchaeota archaeon]|nr:hypothetical protein [Euryarchaeota archaeon]